MSLARRAALSLATVLLASLPACDPASPDACDDAAAITGELDVGTGDEAYEPLQDGDEVRLVRGSQGGLMVYGSLRAAGIVDGSTFLSEADAPVVDFEVLRDGLSIGGYAAVARPFDRDADDTFTLVGDTLILDSWDSAEVDGVDVTLSAHLTDACGRELSSERKVTLAAE